jgi:ribosomal protein L37AE/L43A
LTPYYIIVVEIKKPSQKNARFYYAKNIFSYKYIMKILNNEKHQQLKLLKKAEYDKKHYESNVKDAYQCEYCFKAVSKNYKDKHCETRAHKRNEEFYKRIMKKPEEEEPEDIPEVVIEEIPEVVIEEIPEVVPEEIYIDDNPKPKHSYFSYDIMFEQRNESLSVMPKEIPEVISDEPKDEKPKDDVYECEYCKKTVKKNYKDKHCNTTKHVRNVIHHKEMNKRLNKRNKKSNLI